MLDHNAADEPSHNHRHPHGTVSAPSRRALRLTLAALIPAALGTLVGLIMLWPGDAGAEPWTGPPHYTATVTSIDEWSCAEGAGASTPEGAASGKCGEVTVQVEDGPGKGERLTTDVPSGPGAPVISAGDTVIVIAMERFDEPGAFDYSIIDHERSNTLWAILLAFALTVIAFGRWRGLTALVGLAFTFVVLLVFVVPAILQGQPPLWVAIVGAAAIMLVVLYLTHGFSITTSMAVLGTLASLSLTGALAAISTSLLKLTGVADEEASFLTIQFQDVNMLGLLLAGIVIGSLGVLDDVTVTQAYTVNELSRANPAMGFRGLYQAASRVGRAHITSVINTIVLAYAGASLPLMLLLTAGGAPFKESLTSELLTQEIVRSVVGTMGLIAAVPITTALAALAAAGRSGSDRTVRLPRPRRRRLDPLEQAWALPDEHDLDPRPGGSPTGDRSAL